MQHQHGHAQALVDAEAAVLAAEGAPAKRAAMHTAGPTARCGRRIPSGDRPGGLVGARRRQRSTCCSQSTKGAPIALILRRPNRAKSGLPGMPEPGRYKTVCCPIPPATGRNWPLRGSAIGPSTCSQAAGGGGRDALCPRGDTRLALRGDNPKTK
jgi:hypothetical protein